MARILIVTDGHLCRNPRPFKEATTLAAAGYEVTVLGIKNHHASVAIDDLLCRSASFKIEQLDLLDSSPTGRRRRLLAKFHTWIARKLQRGFSFESIHSLGPARLLLQRTRAISAELTIFHNSLPHWVGLQLHWAGRRFAADIEDWNSEDLLPDARLHRPLRLLRQIEHDLLAQAVFTTSTSVAMANQLFARYGGRRPSVLTNSPLLQPVRNSFNTLDVPGFVWFSQTVGPGRGLEQFLAAWQLTSRPSRIAIVGQPVPGFLDHLAQAVPENRRSALSFLPPVAPTILPSVLSGYDIGLALEPSEPANKNLTISNKILQYLNASLAVVASDTAGQSEVLAHNPAAGIIVNLQNTAGCAQALDRLLADRAVLTLRKQAARQLAEDHYCWELESPRLHALVSAALEQRLPSPSET
jgi:glycosyltransferase involved in cell wall biosynthesis